MSANGDAATRKGRPEGEHKRASAASKPARATASASSWTDANQAFLVAELARLNARLAGDDEQLARERIAAARDGLTDPPAIDQLAGFFGLSAFERDIVLLCAGVEMDAQLASAVAAAGSATGRPGVTFGLALAALSDPHWSALSPVAPLRLWRLIELCDDDAVSSSRIRIDERVLHYLAGVNYLDPRLRPLLRPRELPQVMADAHRDVVEAALEAIERRDDRPPVIVLTGDDVAGQRDVAGVIASRMGLRLHVLAAADIPTALPDLEALAILWQREAALLGGALLIDCTALDAMSASAARFADRSSGLVVVASREPVSVARRSAAFCVDKPEAAARRQLWTESLGPLASGIDGALDGVATQFRLSAEAIAKVSATLGQSAKDSPQAGHALWHACQTSARGPLDEHARRIESTARWDDLVLPESQLATLHQIAAQVRHRFEVYEAWGFAAQNARGLGISALFAGESGTGKTMAAEVLAHELHLDLYRIDLAALVSKYIGETEKNLRRVFDAAEDSGAILLFDEADALFGKRSEVRDSHDRYANIEVSYLLQRMEAYCGLAILTTNMQWALDTSFLRRLRFVVQFPFPDHAQRERIWRGIFPDDTPLDGIDYAKLAQLNIAGGGIRNIALGAAFLAADRRRSVGMSELLDAAHAEAAKRERPFADAETRGWQ
jgi:hypothetical protein